jgi:hypothetical protein
VCVQRDTVRVENKGLVQIQVKLIVQERTVMASGVSGDGIASTCSVSHWSGERARPTVQLYFQYCHVIVVLLLHHYSVRGVSVAAWWC